MKNHKRKCLKKYAIVCLDEDSEACERLVHSIRRICGSILTVVGFSEQEEAFEWVQGQSETKVAVAILIIAYRGGPMHATNYLANIQQISNLQASKTILLTDNVTTVGKDLSDRDVVDEYLSRTWNKRELNKKVRRLLSDYFIQSDPEFIEEVTALADEARLSRHFTTSEQEFQGNLRPASLGVKTFITCRDIEDETLEARVVDELEKTIGSPKTIVLDADDMLLREGQILDSIWIILSGRVKLYRIINNEEIVFHSKSVGQIIGLQALSQKDKRSSFDCKAATDTTLIPLTLNELNKMLQDNKVFAGYFLTVILRSLGKRNRRAVELQIEINTLNRALENERDQLKRTLKQLEQAQMRLIQSEKMATLGQLTAGMAHELNNPITAIRRAADFIYEDIEILVRQFEAKKMLISFLHTELEHEALPPKNQREIRKSLAQTFEDNDIARRLVKVGIYNYQRFKEIFSDLPKVEWENELRRIECYTHLGKSLRNIRSCAERITELVNSLRSYTRADREMSSAIDVHRGIEDTLLMFRHACQNIRVGRNYAKLPLIQCFVGELNQVWTNIIANALQAMDYRGILQIKTESVDGKYVRVSIIDDGPGIPPKLLRRIFDLNFTTKHGRAEFGLGLGLTICHQIVSRHNGKIFVESKPGRTCFTITLPISQSNCGQNLRDKILSLSNSSIQEQT